MSTTTLIPSSPSTSPAFQASNTNVSIGELFALLNETLFLSVQTQGEAADDVSQIEAKVVHDGAAPRGSTLKPQNTQKILSASSAGSALYVLIHTAALRSDRAWRL